MKKKTASTIICQNFKIPPQTIFQDFKCSYKSGLTYFGRLYVGQDHVLFIANMFGILKKCIIQIDNLTKIQQPSKGSIIINDNVDGMTNQYSFNGFKTNHAYVLIKALWKREKIESEVLNPHQDEVENSGMILGEDQSSNPTEKLADEGNVQANFFNPNAVESEKQKLCEFQLPCSVQQYYNFFLADDAKVYPRAKHLELRNSREIVVSKWKKNEELQSDVLQISAKIKISGVPFLSQAHMNQVWKLKKNQNNEIFIQIVTQMSDVPYHDYFVVNSYCTVLKDGDKKCRMIIEASIVFSKSTYMKGKVLKKSIADMKEDFEFWVTQVKRILNNMRKSQQIEGNRKSSGGASEIMEYETNMPLLSSQKLLRDSTKPLSKVDQSSLNDATVKDGKIFEKKIDKLTRVVYVLLAICFIQLILTGVLFNERLNSSEQCGTSETEDVVFMTQSDHQSDQKDPEILKPIEQQPPNSNQM